MWKQPQSLRATIVAVLMGLGLACATTGSHRDQSAWEDLVTLDSGDTVSGRVLAESEDKVVVAQRYGTFTFSRAQVRSITRGASAVEVVRPSATHRLSPFSNVIAAAGTRWATGVRQIPATVIDTGVLRHVPYISHRAGAVEINVYGDPDAPSCIEVGAKQPTPAEKEQLRTLVAELLLQPQDREVLAGLSLDAAKTDHIGMTFEITPDDAADAYGAWWISVYDPVALESARASEAELQHVAASADDTTHWPGSDPSASWRPRASGGRVFVRGYFRKNGTYVHSHSRRR